jgi:rRNA-processing protein FCF1
MEVKVVLDTNRLTDLFRGDASLTRDLGKCDLVLIQMFVLAEIMAGFEGSARHAKNEFLLRTLCVHRNAVLSDPRAAASTINGFVGGHLDIARMAAQVKPELNHHIASASRS